jgi:hypothetical protein
MPGDENLTTRTAETMDGALFELKLVGDIAGWFRVARYQRGYRVAANLKLVATGGRETGFSWVS